MTMTASTASSAYTRTADSAETSTAQHGLSAPQLPSTIDGDGRYVMSLLTGFCTEVTSEVNRANGITKSDAPPAIDEFFVSFDREGVLWQWSAVKAADYYELTAGGTLLAHTADTFSHTAPPTASGTVTLTAHLTDGRTAAASLDYTKPRPHAPTNVSLSRTSDGTRIAYDDIPSDCIGAQITACGRTYRTTQPHCLIYTDSDRLGNVTAAYYDSFGIGEVTVLTTDIPTVTGLFAEQNGEWLDLSWDSLPIEGIRYLVKVAYRSPDWDSAQELITVSESRARLRFPQAGAAYFLVKAAGPYGGSSAEAAWTMLDRTADYRRNVILTLDQADTAYSGIKTDLYYDAAADGLRLTEGKRRGEYLITVRLPDTYRARSWLEAKLIGVTDDTLAWDDSTFRWSSEDSAATVWNGACGDIGGATLRTEIAEAAPPLEGETVWTMNGTLLADDLTAPTAAQHADTFAAARWNQGLLLTPLTRLTYKTPALQTFGIAFHLICSAAPADSEIVTLRGEDGALTLRYTDGAFTLIGTDGARLTLPYRADSRDCLAVGIEQTDSHRTLRLASLTDKTDRAETISAQPCADITEIGWHPHA